MIIQTRKGQAISAILNHPSVRPNVDCGYDGWINAEDHIQPPHIAYLSTDGGVVIFGHVGDRVYEGHIFCIEGSRGAYAIKLGKLALKRLFADHRALKVVAYVPLHLPSARYLCRKIGLKAVKKDDKNEYFNLEVSEWAV